MMVGKKLKLLCAHFLVVAVAVAVSCCLYPSIAFCCFSRTAYFLLYLIIAYTTFGISKRWFLKERILPDNKAVLITGCDTGLGNQLAQKLDSLGFRVFASCLFPDGEGAQKLKQSCSDRLQILYLDVTKDKSVEKALKFVEQNLGSSVLWAVVNNAGILKSYSAEFTTLGDFEDTMKVNTFGMVRVTKAFMPLIKKSKGRIVNVTSSTGRIPTRWLTAYSMSKFAAVAFTDCLSQEMSVWGIRVISIEPGAFRSPLIEAKNLDRLHDEMVSKLKTDILDDYGTDYFNESKRVIRQVLQILSSNLNIVISDIESAITLKDPDHVYKPRRDIISRILMDGLQYLPHEILEKLIAWAERIALPLPKKIKDQTKLFIKNCQKSLTES